MTLNSTFAKLADFGHEPPMERPPLEREPAAASRGKLSWPVPPDDLHLAGDEVHVWCAFTDLDPSPFWETLSDDERDRSRRFRFERDCSRFIARRGLLRQILGRYVRVEPERLSFIYEPRGKPVLSGFPAGQSVHFNLSHSDGLVLLAFCRKFPLGVDVERVRPMPEMDGMIANIFSEAEKAALSTVPGKNRLETFFNAWTRKEACLKATGEGISAALARVEVSLLPGEPARVLRAPTSVAPAKPWSLHTLFPASGFLGALAIAGTCHLPACWSGHLFSEPANFRP